LIRTLQAYLGREIIKAMGVALIAFTLLMTLFAIMEPLRKRGLGPEQILSLFLYTIPVMLSMTLPIAALFGTTFAYGRFSQDNELTACRASGIATITLLKPAIAMGILVTVATLVLSNVMAPKLAEMGARAAEANLRSMLYHKLRNQGYFKYRSWLLHADRVDAPSNRLEGVVVADLSPGRFRMLAASEATVRFQMRDEQTYVTVFLTDAVETDETGTQLLKAEQVVIPSPPLPDFIHEKPTFYGWRKLWRMYDNPGEHSQIQRELASVKRDLLHAKAVEAIRRRLSAGGSYELTGPEGRSFTLRAPKAWVAARGHRVLLARVSRRRREGRVEVTVRLDGVRRQVVHADRGEVEAAWSPLSNASHISLKLTGNVDVTFHDPPGPTRHRRDWSQGLLAIPPEIQRSVERIDFARLLRPGPDGPEDLESWLDSNSPSLLRKVRTIQTETYRDIRSAIVAEIHGRTAYGLSCLLLVSLGAALGILFKGGQVVAALGLAAMPSALVGVMIVMGQQMLQNPGVPEALGLAGIWGGNVLLLIANGVVYAWFLRR
jgi:lipopolysaccharide export LptBFGC system permease protein LptF